MNQKTQPGKPRMFRRKYLIDKPTQLGVTGWLLGGLLGIGVMYVAAMVLFLSPEATKDLDSNVVRRLLLTANAAYFLFAAILVVTLAVLLSHRFVGPGFVLRQALDGMLKGDYTKRLSLRKTDYLKDVAGLLSTLRDRWVTHERTLGESLSRLEHCVETSDHDEALRIVKALHASLLVPSLSAPAVAPATDVSAAAPSREVAAAAR